jgi:hypothetical protein
MSTELLCPIFAQVLIFLPSLRGGGASKPNVYNLHQHSSSELLSASQERGGELNSLDIAKRGDVQVERIINTPPLIHSKIIEKDRSATLGGILLISKS